MRGHGVYQFARTEVFNMFIYARMSVGNDILNKCFFVMKIFSNN